MYVEHSLFKYLLFLFHVILLHSLFSKIYIRMNTSVINGKELNLFTDKMLAQF
jgi:hypothetical protein